MRLEVLVELRRRLEEHARKIASGEIKVCSTKCPMPPNRDQMGQHWFHEEAKRETNGLNHRDKDGNKVFTYYCSACKTRFPVTARQIVV